MKLEGKVALVTGGGTGIGKAIAKSLLEEGCKVIIVGRRKEKLDEAASELGGNINTIVCDVTEEEQVANRFRKLAGILKG